MRRKNICKNNKTYDDVSPSWFSLLFIPIFPLVFPVKSKYHKKSSANKQINFVIGGEEVKLICLLLRFFIVRQMSGTAPEKVC